MPDQEADEYVVSDPELITRVRTGDREAFGELYKRHAGAATTLSRQFARSATESDDLVSESFARVLDNLLAGKGPDTAFRAYLFTTIRNTAYDRTRKDKRLQFTDDMTTHDSAVVGDDPVLAKMESGLVAAAFAQLPERWQAVLWHTQVEGETPAQVGALLGMAPGAVSSLAFRAREGLREAYLQAHLAETAAEQCRTTVERLGAWTRGGLSKREKAQVDAHLETCERCRALAAELEEVNHGLRGLLAPLLLGGAAAGYLATLGPVAPLAAPGTLIAGAGSTGAGSGAGGAGGSGAGGSGAGGSGGAGAAGGGAGAAGGATAGSAAATAAGVAAAAAAVAAGAIGVAALASAGSSGATAAAAGTGAAAAGAGGGGAAGAAGAAASGGGAAGAAGAGASGGGAAGAGGGTAGGGAGAAAGAGTAAGAGAAAGGGAVFAGLGVGGLVAAGAALLVAAVAAVVFVVSGNSPDTTNTAGQDVASSDAAPASDTGAVNDPGAAGGITLADPGATDGTAGTAASVPIVPGADPATTGATDGAVVPIVDTTSQQPDPPQPTAPTSVNTIPNTSSTGNVPSSSSDSTSSVPGSSLPSSSEPTPTGPTTTEPTTTEPTPTTPPPPVADLVVTFPTVAPPLNAGATGTVSLTVTNNGDGASAAQPADLVLPGGVQVTNVEATAPVPALRRAAMGLLRAGPCLSAQSTNCSIDLPAVPAGQRVTVTLTLAVDSTATGGEMTITVLGKPFTIALQVNSPAALGLSDLQVTQDLYAGGTGQLSVRVTNSGQQPSTRQTVNVSDLPAGVTVSGVTGNGVTCAADQNNARAVGSPVCTLLPVDPDAGGTLLIDLDVPPSAPSSTETATTLTLGDNTDGPSRSLTVLPSILSLDTAAAGPFTAGQPATLAVIPDVRDGVTNTGPITVTSTDAAVTFRPSSGCLPIDDANAVTCASSGFVLDIDIPVDHKAGPLEITATDAGGRRLDFPSVTLRIVAAAPANLEVTGLTTSQPLTAGGTGQLALDVSNKGQQASIDQEIKVDGLPDSVTPTDITIRELSTCDQQPAGNAPVAAGLTCTLPPLDPGQQVTLLIDLDVLPSAPTTVAPSVTIGGTLTGEFGPLTVVAGITGLDTSPAGPFLAGRPLQLTLTPKVPDTITAGDITLTSTDPTVTFGAVPGCDLTAQADAVTCSGNRPFTVPVVIPATHDAGDLLITAVDEGQRQLSFTSKLQIQAATPARLTLDKLTASKPLIAGGTGRLTVLVTNNGQQTSSAESIGVSGLPEGVSLSDITIDGTSVCDPPQAENARELAADASGCRLLPLEPGQGDLVLIDLDVAPFARTQQGTDTTTISIGDNLTSASLPLTVLPGITALDTAPAGPFTAGQPAALTVTPQLADTVTNPGPITVTSQDPTVTFAPSAGCAQVAESNAVSCSTSPFDLKIVIPVDHVAGKLDISATDAGERSLRFTNILEIVAAAPANLEVTGLTTSQPLTAGGTGQLTVTVKNTGELPSADEAIDVDLPQGITVTGLTADGSQLCTISDGRVICEDLPSLDAGQSRTLVITLAVASATTSEPEPGYATVTIGDGPVKSSSTPLTVGSAITSLSSDAKNPLFTGSTTTLRIKVAATVEEPGPITFIATGTGVSFGKSAGCDAPSGTSTIVCDGDSIGLSITISADQAPGILPVTVVDAGDRKLDLKDAAGQDFRIERAKPSLQIDKPSISTPLLAGGTGGVTVQVSNTGGQRSEKGPIEIDLPDGVKLSGMTYGESALCTAVRDAAPTCTLPEIDPGKPITVVIDLTVQPDAKSDPGNAKVVIPGDTESVPLAVEAGISALVADERGPLTAGTTVKLTVRADLLKGVTEAGRVTLTAADGVVFGESSGCSPTKGGSTIDCDGSGFTATVVIPANYSADTLSVKAADAGQRTVALLDAARKSFEVVAAPKHLDVSDLEVEQLPNLSGTITLKVSNPADAPSAPMPIDIVLPKGFTTEAVVSVFEPKFRLTVCTNPPCTLEPVDSRGSATLYVGFTAREGATTGPAIVTIDGVTKEAQVIGGGLNVDLLKPKTENAPTDIAQPRPLIGGQSDQSLPIPPTPATGSAAAQSDPLGAGVGVETETPSVDATPTGTAPTSAGKPSAGATSPSSPAPTTPSAAGGPAATDTSITDTATMDATTPADPTTSAPSTQDITPSSIEDTTPAPATTSDAPTTRSAGPAAVALSRPAGAETLTAGGTGALRFSATNSGGERSGPTAFDIDLPAGVIVQSVSINGSTICESRSCQLPGIEPGASITVVVDIAAALDAATGGASATIDGSGVGWMVTVEPAAGPGTGDTPTAVLPTAVIPGLDDLIPAGN